MPYPRVADSLVRPELGASVRFAYLSHGEQLDVEEVKPGHCRLVSPGWRPKLDSLTVRAHVSIEHPELLFANKSDKTCCVVAGEDADIGVVMKWMLPETKIRGVIVGETALSEKKDAPLSMILEKTFDPAMVRNRAEFSVELFLIRSNLADENVYARIVGSNLASIGGIVLHTGGSGGMFPTSSKAAGATSPLWELDININDREDLDRDFSGDVCMLYLNSDHRLYPEVIRADMSGAVAPLMFEIFSECCVMLLLRVLKTLNDADALDDLDDEPDPDDEGMSTIDAVRSMKRRLFPEYSANELSCMEVEKLSKEARINLGKTLKQSAQPASEMGVH